MAYYQQAWSLWKQMDVDADPSAALLGKDVSGEMSTWLLLNNLRCSDSGLVNEASIRCCTLQHLFFKGLKIFYIVQPLALLWILN